MTTASLPGHLIGVFLVDDHGLLRRGLRDLLESESDLEVVGECEDARSAIARIPAVRPDVVVLDMRLPDGSGIEVCRQVRSLDPSISVLMLTSFDGDDDVLAAIMAGAAGYVLKDVDSNELLAAVRRVAAGQSILDPAVTARVLQRLRQGPTVDPEVGRLTEGERRIVLLLAEGLTNRQIATRTRLSEKTVKNYVSDVLTKLNLTSRTQAAVFAVEHASDLRGSSG